MPLGMLQGAQGRLQYEAVHLRRRQALHIVQMYRRADDGRAAEEEYA